MPNFSRLNFNPDGWPIYLVDHKPNNYMGGFIFGQTAQMSMNRGLKVFGDIGAQAFHKEMKQLHDRKFPIPLDPDKLSRGIRSSALTYLMLLKMKREG